MSAEFNHKVFEDLSYGLYIATSRDKDHLKGECKAL